MNFRIETIIGDRYESTDSLNKDEIHDWLLNIQKQDILKVETDDDYLEDIPDNLFELFKTKIRENNTLYTKHLYLIFNKHMHLHVVNVHLFCNF